MRGHVLALLLSACTYAPEAADPLSPNSNPPDGPDTDAPVADATPACSNGTQDPGEIGVDCGGTCEARCTTVFTPDTGTLAIFEFNGDLSDASGNGRDATSIGGSFAPSAWGMGLALDGVSTQGFQWNAFAPMIVHPYTIEMVVTPVSTSCYKKLFGTSDSSDSGWYYCGRFRAYPSSSIGPTLAPERHYLAMVSTSATQMRVYVNGVDIGTSGAAISSAPTSALFFRDDSQTNRNENVDALVDAIRISGTTRSADEILAIQARLATQP